MIENICKAFGSKQVLQGVSAEFPEPGITCLMGPSGCGKTTLLHILMGIIAADSGSIWGVSGKRFAALFQEDRLLPWFNAYDNAAIALPYAEKGKAKDTLSRLGLDPHNKLPVTRLSGGMQRRVALARALVIAPELLFLDEPLKGFDEELKVWIMELLQDFSQHHTIIMVTHDMDEARYLGAKIVQMR